MAQKIRWSPKAASNFEEICEYIAKDSEVYATLFANKINAAVKSIPQFPKAGRIVPEYGDENIREKIYENYRIIYISNIYIVLKERLLKLLRSAIVQSH